VNARLDRGVHGGGVDNWETTGTIEQSTVEIDADKLDHEG
jgi:hypothetical protein